MAKTYEIADAEILGDTGVYLSPELEELQRIADQERDLKIRHDALAVGRLAVGSLLAGVLARGAWQRLRTA